MAKQRLNFATYPQDYYTGAQAKIYFGSLWVDDIATIQYQTSHSKTPLYGYGDHQFRVVAKGQFLVRGSFTVAFKETGYLYTIMKLVKADRAGLELVGKSKESFDTYINYIGQGYTVEQALDYTASRGTTSKATGPFNASGDFEDIAEVLEDSIWGKPGTPANFQSRIPRSDELDYVKYIGGNKIRTDNDISDASFDILLTFGNYKAGNDSAEHTMISLNNVHITGESMIVSPSAEPIGITYEFFARGLNERIGTSWKSNSDIHQDMAKDAKKKEKDKQTVPQRAAEPRPQTSDNTSNDRPAPAETPSTRKVTDTNPAPNSSMAAPITATNLHDADFENTFIKRTGYFNEVVIKGDPNIKPIEPVTKSIPKTQTNISRSDIPKPPAEIPGVSFNVYINGDIEQAFNKAKVAAPKESVTISGNVSNGSLLKQETFFGLKKDVFKGTYKTYGNVINIKVSYVTLGLFKTAETQIKQFFANL